MKKGASKKEKKPKKAASGGTTIKSKRTLRFWLSSIVWILVAITGGITAAIFFILYGILASQAITVNAFLLIAAMTLSSIMIGFVLASFAPKFTFKRLTKIATE